MACVRRDQPTIVLAQSWLICARLHPGFHGFEDVAAITFCDTYGPWEGARLDHPPESRAGHTNQFEDPTRSDELHGHLLLAQAAGESECNCKASA